MARGIQVSWDRASIKRAMFLAGGRKAINRALRKAGATGLRDMRSEASKRVRERKAIRPAYDRRAIKLKRPAGQDISTMEWAIEVDGAPVPLVAYPHKLSGRTGAKGVSVQVNKGKVTIIPGSFAATMESGKRGIFKRRGRDRLPIDELLGSRPVDALLHRGEAEAVAARGGRSMTDTLARVLPLELKRSGRSG